MTTKANMTTVVLSVTGLMYLLLMGCSFPLLSPSSFHNLKHPQGQQRQKRFSITYRGLHDSGDIPEDTGRYTAGSVVIIQGPGTMKRSGYIFKGWNTRLNGSGADVSPKSGCLLGHSDVFLYAQWRRVDTHVNDAENSFTG